MKKRLLFVVTIGCFACLPTFGRVQSLQRDSAEDPNALFGVTAATAQPEDLIFFIPAQAGGVLGTTVGNVAGWPFKIGYRVCTGDFSMDSFVPPNSFAVRYVGTPFAYVLGSPFWCLKKAFWDGPAWLFSSSEPEPGIRLRD